MTIFVDADSCPQKVREIIAKAALKRKVKTVFAANRKIPFTENEMVEMVVVEKGEGVADQFIIDSSIAGDLAVTRDIPLASELIDKDVIVINDRGDQFTTENIRERLSVRDLMKGFRESGIMPEGQKTFGPKEVQKFAAAFDRELTKLLKPANI
ncbi:MAG: YaiI/YqxD family protein [Spirochaetales bacterium]|nr:YaiI/YqxD family protein [Spirochaetales bacterium]